jgi:hypothetical protein
MTEAEEHRFWETHVLGNELLSQMESPGEDAWLPPRRRDRINARRSIPFFLGAAGAVTIATAFYVARRAVRLPK